MELLDKYRGCLLGLAVGDAIGTSVEFMPRGTFEPVTDMTGGGFFNLPVGYWTDDTSMALCLGTSILECDGFDPIDQLERYVKWYREGYMSSTGKCFDIGRTTRDALMRFEKTHSPYCGSVARLSSGNGGIMRLAPVVLAYHDPLDIEAACEYAVNSSCTTHASKECREASHELSRVISAAIGDTLLYWPEHKTIDQIRGSGRASESLEAAHWCVWHTDNFKDAVLAAANLGDDADTTAAITGQIAGALYGVESIPKEWLDKLYKRDMIEKMAIELYEFNGKLRGTL